MRDGLGVGENAAKLSISYTAAGVQSIASKSDFARPWIRGM